MTVLCCGIRVILFVTDLFPHIFNRQTNAAKPNSIVIGCSGYSVFEFYLYIHVPVPKPIHYYHHYYQHVSLSLQQMPVYIIPAFLRESLPVFLQTLQQPFTKLMRNCDAEHSMVMTIIHAQIFKFSIFNLQDIEGLRVLHHLVWVWVAIFLTA